MAKVGKFIEGAIELIIGLILLPVVTGFIVFAQSDANTSSITGMTLLLSIIGYAFAFGLIGVGLKTMKG